MSKKQKPTIEPDALPSDHDDNLAEVHDGLSVMGTLSAPVIPDVDAQLDARVKEIDRRSTARGAMFAERQAEAAAPRPWTFLEYHAEYSAARKEHDACASASRAADEALRKAKVRLDNAATSVENARTSEKV